MLTGIHEIYTSTNSKQIAIVSEGVPISVYEVTVGGTWYKVGLTGYIFHEFLKPVPNDG